MSLFSLDPFSALSTFSAAEGRPSSWSPRVDIHEDKDAYAFEVEAPGLKRENFSVSVEENVLTVSGERKQEEATKERQFHRVERQYGQFTRSFWLPETADTEKVSAEYNQGVLTVKIAKKEAAKPRQIEIKAAA